MEPTATAPTATGNVASATGPIAERAAELRELARTDAVAAQDQTWAWFKELGNARDADSLEQLFGLGTPPANLDGPTEGILVVPLIQGIVDLAASTITRAWMPWQGKSFDLAAGRGYNRLTNSSRWPSKLLWPRYSSGEAPGGRAAFDFVTGVEPGRIEPAVDVLKIDYSEVDENPGLIIRSIRDELVQIVPDTHLGRILWKNRDSSGYKNIGYFALKQPAR